MRSAEWAVAFCAGAGTPHSALRTPHSCPPRFSLLEVVLALAILVGAIAVTGELVRLGTLSAASARDLTQAQLICESKLAEITSGITPPRPCLMPRTSSIRSGSTPWRWPRPTCRAWCCCG